MKSVLYLVHRIPYPPNKGDKIRSFNLLKYLSSRYDVHLATFVDQKEDLEHIPKLSEYTASYKVVYLHKKYKTLLSLQGFLSSSPLSIPYFYDAGLSKWIKNILDTVDISNIVVFSSPMAQYVISNEYDKVNRIMDFVDVDSEKWSDYAKKKTFPASFIFRREAILLREYEERILRHFDKSLFVTRDESELFKDRVSDVTLFPKIDYFNNGVDTRYFSKDVVLDNPYDADSKIIVFTGAMDYWANVDAVSWFVDKVFRYIYENTNKISFYIVGGGAGRDVYKLGEQPGVIVTGRVDDIRPYIMHADVVVAPMRIARGVQNKVLEAMSLAKPIVLTSPASEGINAVDRRHYYIEDDEICFANTCSWIIKNIESDEINNIRKNAELYIRNNYSWEAKLRKLDTFLV